MVDLGQISQGIWLDAAFQVPPSSLCLKKKDNFQDKFVQRSLLTVSLGPVGCGQSPVNPINDGLPREMTRLASSLSSWLCFGVREWNRERVN